MTEPIRISAKETRKKMLSGDAVLVCAYDDEEKFKKMHLQNGISFHEFKSRVPSLSKNQEIIFYCA